MNRSTLLSVLLVSCCALMGQSQPSTFHRELLVGSWKATPDSGPTLYREYEDCGDGFMMHTLITVDPAQKHARLLVATVKYDGQAYPTYASQGLAAILRNSKPPVQTVAFKVMDAYTLEWADRSTGTLTAGGTVALSPDGKTMTHVTSRYDSQGKAISTNTLVYEKISGK